jgi:adenylate cyclase class IV
LANELELKAVVHDAAALRHALRHAGATLAFRGMMRDRRLDCGGALVAREEVLRLRTYEPESGPGRCEITWKGPTTVTPTGYKQREEVECGALDGEAAFTIFRALGYEVVHAIDRFVELWHHPDASARLEWYPRMDLLLEIEGTAEGMERLIAALGLDRSHCRPDALNEFAARYAARSRQRAVWAEADLAGTVPGWANA